jgi:hypothetical protein
MKLFKESIMQPAHLNLIKFTLENKHTISVWDGEEWAVKKCSSYNEIKSAIEAVEEAELTIRDSEGNKVAWALVSAYGLADDETVIDYTVCDFMQQWEDNYNEQQYK